MAVLSLYLPPFSPDYSGVSSVFFDLNTVTAMHDADGCTGNYTGYDEPRWYGSRAGIFCSCLREIDAVLGDDEKLIKKMIAAAQDIHPDVMSLVGSPVPMVIGSDLEGIAAELEARTHIPCFGFNTTGTAYYDKGAAKATIALLHRFTSCTETVPRRINIVGATPMDFGTGENIDDLVSLVSDAGYHVWCRLTMGYTLEQLKQAASAEVNLAVSRTGYLIAEFMWQRYRIPYLCGLPMGQNGSMSYLDSLEKVIQRKTPVILRGEPCEDPDVLIVGEQVQANSIRIALASEYGISNVAVGCIFGCQDQLKLSQDLDLRCEREILTALNESRYNMIVADPLLKNLLPRGNRACFKAHPQYAVSSKAGGESVRFISKYFNHWYEKG